MIYPLITLIFVFATAFLIIIFVLNSWL